MSALGASTKLLLGNVILFTLVAGGVYGATRPEVATPASRVGAAMLSAFETDREDDILLNVASLHGIKPGLPVFFLDRADEQRPIAHVLDMGEGGRGAWVQLRFEPLEEATGPWTLTAYPPSRKLSNALRMAVTADAAKRFGAQVGERMEGLWNDVLLPDLKERLPGFLERIDPTKDTEAREVMSSLSKSVMEKLDPLLDDLAKYVTRAVRKKFDLLDRLGLLVKVVSGDSKGLSRKILPVAKDAAKRWWEENEARVLKAVGEAFAGEMPKIRAWATGELFKAARDELAVPIFEARRDVLEKEGEYLLKKAADEFIRAPQGGFRVRFAALLRTQLLNKKTALLLLERTPPAR